MIKQIKKKAHPHEANMNETTSSPKCAPEAIMKNNNSKINQTVFPKLKTVREKHTELERLFDLDNLEIFMN
jgi:hypothetical protein